MRPSGEDTAPTPYASRMIPRLTQIQDHLRQLKIDAWLVHDFRGNNAVLAQLLPGRRWTTRRCCLLIPAEGSARIAAHFIDKDQFHGTDIQPDIYLSWPEYRAWLASSFEGKSRIAMEYSPGAMLPVVSVVDAGTVELVRSLGVEVVSSADLIQTAVAVWSPEATQSHTVASEKVGRVKDEAFAFIREKIAGGRETNELEVQKLILKRFAEEGLETLDAPIVGANANSGNPHFEVSQTSPAPIKKGDWVLIDLWARLPGDENVFSDITWVGYCGKEVPARQRQVFEAVKAGRDAAVTFLQAAWKHEQPVQGWQADEACRQAIIAKDLGQFIRHRTGHSLSAGPKVHGVGVNIDNLETHDSRLILPGVGWTIEPGLYLPEFGCRLEINMHCDPARGPVVTSGIQRDVLLLA